MALLPTVITALIELATQAPAEHAWDAARRREGVIRTLKRLKLDPDRPPTDFDGLYAYALVEWGAYKPAPVLEFFRHDFVRDAFRRAFYEDNPDLLAQEAEGVIDWSRETGRLGRLEYDPRREFAAFTAVFNRLLDYARTPAEARQEQRLVALQQALAAIQASLAAQPTLADLRALAQSPLLPSAVDDEARLHSYLALVARRAARLPLAPLDPAGRESAHLELVQLFINLEAGEAAAPFKGGRPDSGVYTAALGHIHAQPQLILLGDPGSGKSTLLRFLALCLAQARLTLEGGWLEKLAWPVWRWADRGRERDRLERLLWDKPESAEVERCLWTAGPLIPVFLELRDFARTPFDPRDEAALWRFACAGLERDELSAAIPALRRAARRGQLLWLLDGVDEVPPAQRLAVWQAIGALHAGAYGGNRWVATCRQLSFNRAELPVAGWPEQLLRPLSEAHSADFIARWYAALTAGGELNAAQAEDKTRRLQAAIRRPGLQPLARNPMLLTIMALVQTYHGALPEERARLYQACVETLLLRWQRHKELDAGQLPDGLAGLGVSQDSLERLLGEIAWEAQQQAPGREEAADIPEAEVIRLATQHFGSYARAEAFVAYTEQRAHLLIGKGGLTQRVFSFPHRTFQEYLAACHLAGQRRFARRAAELAAQGDVWREVLNLAAGALTFNQRNREKALDAIEQVLPAATPAADDQAGWQRVWLAGEMAAVVGAAAMGQDEVGRDLLPRLHAALADLIAQATGLTPPQRAAAGEALDRLGWLPPDLNAWRLCPACGDRGQDLLAARYPVTNYQFSLFMAADGYQTRAYWSAAGWRWRVKEHDRDWRGSGPVTEPQYWRYERFGQERRGYPVVGVSRYEAEAYSGWLAALLARQRAGESLSPPEGALVADLLAGKGGPPRLLTDAEWVRVAGGEQDERYPWDAPGDAPTSPRNTTAITARANVGEAGIGRTTPVALFPLGASQPYRLLDLAGNVWEWTQENALRGGSWDDDTDHARVSARDGYYFPSDSYIGVGFRVVSPVLLAAGS